jgi:hypothetical protein
MEPHREEQKAPGHGAEQKPKRFRIVKLEERIAPKKGGKGTNNCTAYNCETQLCTADGPTCPSAFGTCYYCPSGDACY